MTEPIKIMLKDNTEYKLESDGSIIRLEVINGKIYLCFTYDVFGVSEDLNEQMGGD